MIKELSTHTAQIGDVILLTSSSIDRIREMDVTKDATRLKDALVEALVSRA